MTQVEFEQFKRDLQETRVTELGPLPVSAIPPRQRAPLPAAALPMPSWIRDHALDAYRAAIRRQLRGAEPSG